MLTPATPADLPHAVALINSSYRGESSRHGWTNEADYIDGERTTVEALESDLSANGAARLYLERDAPGGPILGCVWLEPRGEGVWYLGLLTVRPDLQDRRLGRTILVDAENLVRQAGGSIIRMTVVHLRHSLISWYQRRGYRKTEDVLPFLYGDALRNDLHFVVLEKQL